MTDSSDAELLNIFWVEVGEYLQSLNAALLKAEMSDADDDEALLREMNRVAHSMKGAARAVGIHVIETISHYMEEVFGAALQKKMALTPDVADLIYDGLDLIQNVVNGEENSPDTLAEVLGRLEEIVAASAFSVPSAPEVAPPSTEPVVAPPTPAVEPVEVAGVLTPILRPGEDTIRVPIQKLDRLMADASELLVAKLHGEQRVREINQLTRLLRRWQRDWRSVRAAYIRLARRTRSPDSEMVAELTALFKFLEANQRYLTEALRQLNQLSQARAQDVMQLSTLADQFQDDIGGMRLVQFQAILGGFQRMVRDLARELGKQIHLQVYGAEVELDKTVLEVLKDPMMHVLRNAVDHGLESPAERKQAGKPAEGRIELAVEQRGNEIIVLISDDGRGIDPERIRRAALQRGLVTEQEAAALSDDDARGLIFHAGLSTSETVTALSGRGVGMDVVRDRVESLRGRVSVQSTVGQGTTISLRVPVSLTRIRCVLLGVGHEAYAVPSAMVVRMDTLKRDDVFTVEGRQMVLINNEPMPLVSLAAILDVPTPEHAASSEFVISVVLHAADRKVAFEVDSLQSELELVLKPLGHELMGTPYISGAALLGSGDVIIVLDANDLVRSASGVALPVRRISMDGPAAEERKLRVLIVDDSITTRTLEKNILETAGFDVRVAIDGIEAWTMLAETEFDVVISDIEMPNMDGFELTKRIKQSTQTQHIPVILLTSLSKPEHRETGLSAGADAYLVKSQFDQDELLHTLRSVI